MEKDIGIELAARAEKINQSFLAAKNDMLRQFEILLKKNLPLPGKLTVTIDIFFE